MMEETILYPCIPYMGRIGGTSPIAPQTLIRIEGFLLEPASRFNINFQCGPMPINNIAVQIYAQLFDGKICLNSLRYGIWDEEQWISIIPLKVDEMFEIIVLFQCDNYKIIINDQVFDFSHRIPYSEIGYLCINGDVSIIKISCESTAAIISPPRRIENSVKKQSPCFKETTMNNHLTDLPANTNITANSNSTPTKTTSWICHRIFLRCCITIILVIIVGIAAAVTGASRKKTIYIKPIELPPNYRNAN